MTTFDITENTIDLYYIITNIDTILILKSCYDYIIINIDNF